MRYLLSLVVIIVFIVAETSVLPYMPSVFRFYDFLVPFAVYLSLYQSLATGLPVIIAGGMAMDMLSGAPMGIYLASYLWIYLIFRLVPGWVRFGDHILFFFLSIIGVAIENVIFATAVWVISNVSFFTVHTGKTILLQLFWTMVTAPFLWIFFQFLFAGLKTDINAKQ